MRTVLISTSDIGNGAGVAAFRLNRALREAGVDSAMVVSQKFSDNENVYPAREKLSGAAGRFFDKAMHFVEYHVNRLGPQCVYSVNAAGLERNGQVRAADVVNFHNIHMEVDNLSLLSILSVSREKPVVWTAHDMWPFTGHCFYPGDCARWETGCGGCPDLKIFVSLGLDTTRMQCALKRFIYRKAGPVIVTPSKWLAGIARRSPLTDGCDVRVIHNGVDTDVFIPMNKKRSRERLGSAPTGKLVMLGTLAAADPRKSLRQLVEALMILKRREEDVSLLVVGPYDVPEELSGNFRVVKTGRVFGEEEMATAYSAADIYVMSSLQENLPNMALESLSCGTPVVCFDAGGTGEIVKHMSNGYLAPRGDVKALAEGMSACLDDPILLEKMGKRGRQDIKDDFSASLMADRYAELYGELIEKRKAR